MKADILKCFIASPCDTKKERNACDEILAEINSQIGDTYNIRIESTKWEKDTFPDFGESGQDVINQQLQPGTQDFFIGIMWKHFGTPTEKAGSGTEEEFNQAYSAWNKNKRLNIQFYFNIEGDNINTIDTDQLSKVNEFKKKIDRQGGLYVEYNGLDDFKNQLRRNFNNSIKERYRSRVKSQEPNITPKQLNIHNLEVSFRYALKAFKGQPEVFIEPKLSQSRDFKDEKNLLKEVIASPSNTIIAAPPQFGLTCLCHHMQLEAYKRDNFWVYINAEHVKTRNVTKYIEKEADSYQEPIENIKCIILDGWDRSNPDHKNLVTRVRSKYTNTPVIVTASFIGLRPPSLETDGALDGFRTLHLQAMGRNTMRKLIDGYFPDENEDVREKLLNEITTHLKSINIHRTPSNCLTLLRVNGSGYNEKLLNKAKLMKAIMFILFTDTDSFSYQDKKPDVDECTYVLAKFCKELIEKKSLIFKVIDFKNRLKEICEINLISLDIDTMTEVLVDNSILLRFGDNYEFKHRYWVFYFAAVCMYDDENFKRYIIEDQRYANYPDIIDFYTGIDERRTGMVKVLMNDLNDLTAKVEEKIGIKDNYNPLSKLFWNPSDEYIEEAQKEIAEKVETSNLPSEIKDKYADMSYESDKPYNQTINEFLVQYKVQKLRGAIAASSRALRNSSFIKPELKMAMMAAISQGWEEISRVTFWISPLLAKHGKASYEGLAFILVGNFSENMQQRFKQILIANPGNIINLVKDDLKSNRLRKVIYKQLNNTNSLLQKHLIALFIIDAKPDGWNEVIQNHLNMLHPRSYYLGNLMSALESEIKIGFINKKEELQLKKLAGAILAKRRYASKSKKSSNKELSESNLLSKDNMLPLDQLLVKKSDSSPEDFGKRIARG